MESLRRRRNKLNAETIFHLLNLTCDLPPVIYFGHNVYLSLFRFRVLGQSVTSESAGGDINTQHRCQKY